MQSQMRVRELAILCATLVLGILLARAAQGAILSAWGLSPTVRVLNMTVFGVLVGCTLALGLRTPSTGLVMWIAVAGLAWMVAGALAVALSEARQTGAFLLPHWSVTTSPTAEHPGGYAFGLAEFLVGAVAALGSTALAFRGNANARVAALQWIGLGALGGVAYALANHSVWVS